MTTLLPRGKRLITLSFWVLLLQLLTMFTPALGMRMAGAQTQPPTHLPAQPNTLFMLGLVADTVTDTDVVISWTPTDAAVKYKLFVGGTEVGEATATSYTLQNLTPHTTYLVSVAAVDSTGLQGSAAVLPVTTRFAAPLGLAVAGFTSTTAELTWQPAAGAAKYIVRMGDTVVAEPTVPTVTLTGLESATSYSVSVVAAEGGAEGLSAGLTFTTRMSAPTGLAVANVTETGATLTWEAKPEVTNYVVRVNDTVVGQTGTPTYTLQNLAGGTAYTAAVAAANPGGVEGDAAVASFATLLPKPENVTAEVTDTTAVLSWSAVAGAAQYIVRYPSLGSGAHYLTTDTSYTLLNALTPGTNYQFQVAAIDGAGREGTLADVTFTTLLAAPGSLTAAGITQNSATLGWSAVTGAAKYAVKMGGTVVGETTETTYGLSGLSADSTYTVTVSAVDGSGRDGMAREATFTTLLPPPESLAVNDVYESGATASWTALGGAADYQVRLNGAPVAVTTATSYSFAGLTDQTAYTVGIAGRTAGGQEGEQITQPFTTSPLRAPSLYLGSLYDTSAYVYWGSVTGAQAYRVWVNGVQQADTTGTNWSLSGLLPGTSYQVQVAAVGQSGLAGSTATLTFTTKLPAPSSVTVSNIRANSAYVSWSSVAGASSYRIQLSTGAKYTTTGTGYTVSSLTQNTSYTVAVSAVSAGGQAGMTASRSFTTTALPAPSVSASYTATNATVYWGTVSGALSYNVWVNGSLVLAQTTATSYSMSGLTPGAYYKVEVAGVTAAGAVGDRGWVGWSTTYIPAPTGLTVSNISYSSAYVSWSPVQGVSSYKVYLNNALYSTTSATSLSLSGLSPDTPYTVSVAGVASGYEGSKASTSFRTLPNEVIPSSPANLRATSVWESGFTIEWGAAYGAAFYEVYVNGAYKASVSSLSYSYNQSNSASGFDITVTSMSQSGVRGGSSSIYVQTYRPVTCDPMYDVCTWDYSGSYIIGAESQQAMSSILSEHGKQIGKLRHQYRNVAAFAAEMTEAEANALRLDPRVKYVERDTMVRASEVAPSWSIGAIKADLVQAGGVNGAGVKVAVIDTGVAAHNDLPGIHHMAFGDLTAGGDENGHGTHVAGTVFAAAPGVELYALKAFDSEGRGRTSDIIAALDWAVENEIQVVNMSFGNSTYSKAFARAVAEAGRKGVLMVAAAGNAGQSGTNTITYPARFPEVIAVGAVDQENQLAAFSSIGSALELVAPGVQILSTLNDGTYGIKSGTSMAAPHVAGAAALVWSHNTKLRNDDVRAILNRTAAELGARSQFGSGLVDAQAAVTMAESNRGEWLGRQNEEKLPKPERFSVGPRPDKEKMTGPADDSSSGAELGVPAHQDALSIWVTQDSTSSANLSWTAVPGASKYQLVRYYPESDSWTPLYEGPKTTHQLTGLTPDSWYYVGVSALRQNGTWSPWSHNVGYAQIVTDTYDNAPQYTFKAAATSTQVIMKVEPCESDKYYYFVRGDAYGNWVDLAYTSSCQLTVSSPANTWYGYGATVFDRYGNFYKGTMGGHGSTIIMTPPPAPVINANPTVTANSITVSWPAVPGPAIAPQVTYVVVVNGTERTETTATTYTIGNLKPDTSYQVSVYAKNKWNGRGDMSAVKTIRTTPPPGTCQPMTASTYVNGTQTTTTETVKKCWDGNGVATLFILTPGVALPSTWVENRDYRVFNQNPWTSAKLLEPDVIILEGSNNQVTVNYSTLIASSLSPISNIAGASGTAKYTIVIAAGINSELDHFNAFLPRIQALYPADSEFIIAFPYGYVPASKANDSKWRAAFAALQAIEVEHDTEWYWNNIGGKVVSEAVGTSFNNPDGHLWLIGHSGGGVASIRGYQMLVDRADFNETSARVITVGSPRTKFNQATASHVYYIFDMGDPVHHVGLWAAYPAAQIQVQLEAEEGFPSHGAYFNGSDADIDLTTEKIYEILMTAEQ